jgi:hypothetical protein
MTSMGRSVLMLCFVAILQPCEADARPRQVIGVLPQSQSQSMSMWNKFVCPCEFDLGAQIDGETALIVDRNGEGQRAFANIEGAFLELRNTTPFESSCTLGRLSRATWEAAGVTLQIALLADGEGEESCWFRGLLTVTSGPRSATRKIIGACGC